MCLLSVRVLSVCVCVCMHICLCECRRVWMTAFHVIIKLS